MSYTLAAAAAACGLNKSTVLRAIKAGKISGTKDEHGEWHIEAAELHRVYPPVAAAAAGNGGRQLRGRPIKRFGEYESPTPATLARTIHRDRARPCEPLR